MPHEQFRVVGGRGTVGGVSDAATGTDRVMAERVRELIDLTDLADDHAPDGIDELCRRARDAGTAAVCVWPEFVRQCAGLLAGSPVRVATVVNFPSGVEPVEQVVSMTRQALADGADDIDVVLPYTSFLAGDVEETRAVLAAVRDAVSAPAIVKVILETGQLKDPDRIASAARLAIEEGVDFVKTSTGKTPTGATHEAAHLMLVAIHESGRPVGLKPSGGIRTVAEAASYLGLADEVMGRDWASPRTFRFGASGLLDDVLLVLGHGPAVSPTDGY